MEEVMDLLHALTKDDPHNVNLETGKIKRANDYLDY